ncbi:CocE/NonD family hydrolase [Reichenbachiella sp. MALMAid0571]|uniref:tetratricopeptide repeat protein n=1 Tax=Reichenbachiella sp. MALMAid0571 TaxID=3143939 RepID=UPI0032DF84E2
MRITFLLILLFIQLNLSLAQVSVEQLELIHGSHNVGFIHYKTFDSSRTYNRIYDWTNVNIPRPIPVSIWYPSDENISSIESLVVLDYMNILKEEEEWEHLPDEQILNWFYYPNTPSNQNHLKEPTSAYPEIIPAKEKFPAIVYAPGYQASSIENFALCEFLASYGYVVISSPSRGTENRFFEGGTEKDMETQAQDIEFLIKEIKQYPYADQNKIATIGFSYGGLSNVLAKMRDDNIRAIVSLDGSIKYQYKTLKKSPFHNIEKVNVPFIHFSQKEIPHEVLIEDKIDSALNTEFEFYDNLKYSEAYHFQFHNLTHSYFSTLGVLFQTRDKRQDKSDVEIMESYRWMSIYTLNFLNAYLKNDSHGLEFLRREPDKNTNQTRLISKTTKPAANRKFSFRDFNDTASRKNYKNLEKLYDSLINVYPTLELPEGNLNNLGLQLIFNPQKSEFGISIFLLATIIYPESANLWDSLAEGYLFIGESKKAIQSFEKSLELYPQNQNAINRLNELRKAVNK